MELSLELNLDLAYTQYLDYRLVPGRVHIVRKLGWDEGRTLNPGLSYVVLASLTDSLLQHYSVLFLNGMREALVYS